eukprot:364502-Chlamydomonas_euryale.AAC.7
MNSPTGSYMDTYAAASSLKPAAVLIQAPPAQLVPALYLRHSQTATAAAAGRSRRLHLGAVPGCRAWTTWQGVDDLAEHRPPGRAWTTWQSIDHLAEPGRLGRAWTTWQGVDDLAGRRGRLGRAWTTWQSVDELREPEPH